MMELVQPVKITLIQAKLNKVFALKTLAIILLKFLISTALVRHAQIIHIQMMMRLFALLILAVIYKFLWQMGPVRIVKPLVRLMRLEKFANQTVAMTLFKFFRRMEPVKLAKISLIQTKISERVFPTHAMKWYKSYRRMGSV
jgi:hypothetical protein